MKNEQKKRELPNTIVIILLIILAACIMTWIIPAGEYVRVKNEAGTSVIDPNQFCGAYAGESPDDTEPHCQRF